MKRTMNMMIALLITAAAYAQQTIQLPEPDKKISMTLMEALQQRHSSRNFSDKEITNATLSQVLWAACGINRPKDGKITAPSAVNAQDIVLFVCRKDGAWKYEAKTHRLNKICDKDLRRSVAGRQEFAAKAPISIIIASDHTCFGGRHKGAASMGMIDSGYVSQNISLVCTALGLNTVPRMTMESETLKKELQLNDNYVLVLNHPVGY